MYDLPQLRQATDAFWQAIAARLKSSGVADVPFSLNRTDDYAATWADPGLLLGQTCGYPLLKQLQDKVQVIAAPIYRSRYDDHAEHGSLFIVNVKSKYESLKNLRGSVCAVNGFDSNTGMNLLRAAIAPLAEGRDFFRSVNVTGSHHGSLSAVAKGVADLAAIDSVSFAHFERFEPELTQNVREIGQSAKTPTPPLITSRETDARTFAQLRTALFDAAADPKLESVCSALLISGFASRTATDYERILHLEQTAARLGYPDLC